MVKTIKKPIKNLPKNLQVHVNFILKSMDDYGFNIHIQAVNHLEKLANKYMKNNFSKHYNYYIDAINKDYIEFSLVSLL